MFPTRRIFQRVGRAVSAILLVSSPLACEQAATHLGRTPAEAAAHADTLLDALGARFGPHELDADVAEIRPRLVRSAFMPSRIFDDAAVWTKMDGDVRMLELAGAQTSDGRYLIATMPAAPAPVRAADYRSTILLQRIEHGVYEWRVHDALALGQLQADDLSRALTALFSAAGEEQDATVRAEYRTRLPRATSTLGRLFSLDTLHLSPVGGGATSVMLGITVHPDRIERELPHFAHYLDKYLSPAQVQLTAYDDAGAAWWDVRGDGAHFTVHFRVRDGSLAPLSGPPRTIPAKLHVRTDAETKLFIFHVGFHNLIADVALTRTSGDKGFVATFQREPEWVLPPFVASMMRTALRRPFAGKGGSLSFDVRDGDAGEVLATRDYRIAIEESQITRWLGGLGNTAVSDFRKGAEEEADRFTGAVFTALRRDVNAMTLAAIAK